MPDRRNVIYLYDGSFDGLLTAVFDSYVNREIPISVEVRESFQQNLFCDCVNIETDTKKAARVENAISRKISDNALINIYETYLSDTEGKELICLEYIRAGFFYGSNVDKRLTINCVNAVMRSVGRIRSEAHQYLGFVRFSELENGVFYSEIAPECNILPLISEHFLKRLPQTPWIIHDTKKGLVSISNGKEYLLTETNQLPKLNYSDKERDFRTLWKEFYKTIEIKERHNERCQNTHLPKKYRKYMTEFMN